MRKVMVTFSGAAYNDTTRFIAERATSLGADDCWVFDDRYLLNTGFVDRNRFLYDAEPKFGFGFCGWKAAIISDALDHLEDGDVVFYTDADCYPIGADFSKVFDACGKAGGVFLFAEQGCSMLRFTKKDCYLAMGQPLADGEIAAGRFSVWQKGPFLPKQMLAEWWAYSVNPRCMLWDHSILSADHPEFARHTTEQSVLSVLAKKYSVLLHRTPDQNGSIPQDYDIYPQILLQVGCTGNRADLSGSAYRNIPWEKK